MEVRRGAKDDELGVVPKYLHNNKIIIIDNRVDILKYIPEIHLKYGNTGCGVFKRGIGK